MKGKTKRYGKVFMALILGLCMIFGNMSAVLAADYSVNSGIKAGDSKQLQSGDKITAGADSVFQVVLNGKVVYPGDGAIKGYQDKEKTKESGRLYGKGSYTLPAAESGKLWKAAAAQNKDWFYDESGAKMRQGAYVITLEQVSESKEEPKEQPNTDTQSPPAKAAVDAEMPSVSGPADAVYDKDAPATALSVTASVSDGGSLSYQWYRSTDPASDGTPVGDGTNSYTPETGTAGTMYYYCVVTNTNSAATGAQTAAAVSTRAAVTVNEPAPLVDAETPVITENLADATYDKDAPAAALSVAASVSDGGILSYQWYQSADASADGTPVGDGTDSYTPATGTAGTTYYYCVVTNTNSAATGAQTAAATSERAAITVNEPASLVDAETPQIKENPQNAAYERNEAAAPLSVTAEVTDGGALSYQWYSNTVNDITSGIKIEGATSDSYTPKTDTAGTSYYYCIVTNTNENATGEKTASASSNAAEVTVSDSTPPADVQTPVIKKDPEGQTYKKGEKANPLSVTAEVTEGTLSYQWYSNTVNDITSGSKIEGAASDSYTPKTDQAGETYYYCIVTNTKDGRTASASSNAAKIVVTETQKTDAKAPKITANPKGASYFTGDTAKELEIKAESQDGGKLTYQWYSNTKNSTKSGTAVRDATNSTYTPSTKDNGTVYYYCVVTNTKRDATGSQTAAAVSDTAKIVVSTKTNAEVPSVSGPSDATYYKGKAAKAMEVKASVKDGGTLSYQWYSCSKNSSKDGSAIKGATSSKYTPSTASVGTTYYYCVVTNTNKSVNGDQTVSVTSRTAKITVKASVTNAAKRTNKTINTKSTRAANAKTGDETNMILWIALLAAAGIVVAVLAVRLRKSRK